MLVALTRLGCSLVLLAGPAAQVSWQHQMYSIDTTYTPAGPVAFMLNDTRGDYVNVVSEYGR